MQFSNPTTVPSSFTVTGGTIDNVTNPVDATAIGGVVDSVPFLFKDTAFWPSLSSEQFPPALGSSASYSVDADVPCYKSNAPAAASLQVTSPNFPRTGYNGKKKVTLSFNARLNYSIAGGIGDTALLAIGLGSYLGNRFIGFRLDSANHLANQWAVRPGWHGAAIGDDFAAGVAGLANNTLQTFQVSLNADGSVGPWILNGNIIRAAQAALWPADGTAEVAAWSLYWIATSASGAHILSLSHVTEDWT